MRYHVSPWRIIYAPGVGVLQLVSLKNGVLGVSAGREMPHKSSEARPSPTEPLACLCPKDSRPVSLAFAANNPTTKGIGLLLFKRRYTAGQVYIIGLDNSPAMYQKKMRTIKLWAHKGITVMLQVEELIVLVFQSHESQSLEGGGGRLI